MSKAIELTQGKTALGVQSFNGIRVVASDLAKRIIIRTKKWKRLNRPAKVKTKSVAVPGAYTFGGTMYAHPDVIKHMQKKKGT